MAGGSIPQLQWLHLQFIPCPAPNGRITESIFYCECEQSTSPDSGSSCSLFNSPSNPAFNLGGFSVKLVLLFASMPSQMYTVLDRMDDSVIRMLAGDPGESLLFHMGESCGLSLPQFPVCVDNSTYLPHRDVVRVNTLQSVHCSIQTHNSSDSCDENAGYALILQATPYSRTLEPSWPFLGSAWAQKPLVWSSLEDQGLDDFSAFK